MTLKGENNSVNEKLRYIFENVNNWLTFAEAKNGALIAINISIIVGFFTTIEYYINNWIVVFLLIMISISLFFAIISFVPLTGNMAEKRLEFWSDRSIAQKNLYLYSYIAKYKLNETEYKRYLDDIAMDCEITDYICKNDDVYLAQEIIYNSKIVLRKYKLFEIAITIFAISVIIFAVAIIIA